MNPVFSVVTVIFNGQDTLASTMQSVLNQTLSNFEFILIDGGSTDKTEQIARSFGDSRIRWQSEPDQGIYDAMNKGIRQARGRYIAILNADDLLADARVLSEVCQEFNNRDDIVVYGDLEYFNANGQKTRRWRTGPYASKSWEQGWHPPHPATFIPKQIYQRHGVYDASYRLAADYKYLLTLGMKAKTQFIYLPRVLVRMQAGGASTSGIGSVIRGNLECLRAWKELGLKSPLTLVPRKLHYKLASHFTRKGHNSKP